MAKVDLAVKPQSLTEKAMSVLRRGGKIELHIEEEALRHFDGSVITVSHPNDLDACLQQAEENAEGLGGSDVWLKEI